MWLGGKSPSARRPAVRVRFDNVGNLKVGNPVKVSGGDPRERRGDSGYESGEGAGGAFRLDPRSAKAGRQGPGSWRSGLGGRLMVGVDPGTARSPCRGADHPRRAGTGLPPTWAWSWVHQAGTLARVRRWPTSSSPTTSHNTLGASSGWRDTYAHQDRSIGGADVGAPIRWRHLSTRSIGPSATPRSSDLAQTNP